MTIRSFVSTALLLLAACPEPGDPQCSVRQTSTDVRTPVGQPISVTATLSVSCFVPNVQIVERPLKVVETVEVEVLDPDNKKVAASVTEPRRSGGNTVFDVSANVAFTPDRPGPWTVIVRFEPNIGRAQQLVRTLDVRADAGVREIPIALPANCQAWGLTASGTPVCTLALATGDTQLAVGGQRFTGSAFAIEGDAIWALGLDRVELTPSVDRLEPDAGVYVATAHRSFPGWSVMGTRFAAGYGAGYVFTGAATFVGPGVAKLVPDGAGGFTRTMLSIGSDRIPHAVVPAADRVVVLANSNTGNQLLISLLYDGGTEVVPTGLGNQQGQPLAYGDGVLWLSKPDPVTFEPTTLVAFDVSAGTLRTGSLETAKQAGGGLMAQPLSPQVPIARVSAGGNTTRPVAPIPGDIELGVEAFVPGVGYGDIISATRAHAFARSDDGLTLKVFDR